jgi:hypothetical protein
MARDLDRYLRSDVKSTPFCPGCGHGILMNQILRAIDELKLPMEKMLSSRASAVPPGFPAPISMLIRFTLSMGVPSPLPQAQRCSTLH